MTRERIEDMREVVLPFVKKRLLETNYENLGESDAEMFAKDFDEILNLAIKALDQEPTTKNDLGVDAISRADALAIVKALNKGWELRVNEVLDKIRAEIKKEADTSNRLQGISEIGLRKALKIIDKYKAESGGME